MVGGGTEGAGGGTGCSWMRDRKWLEVGQEAAVGGTIDAWRLHRFPGGGTGSGWRWDRTKLNVPESSGNFYPCIPMGHFFTGIT